jgi:hypothetical protein
MKMRSPELMISTTRNHGKSCEELMDFLRNRHERPCAKVCGKTVENWRISGGTAWEKIVTDTTATL